MVTVTFTVKRFPEAGGPVTSWSIQERVKLLAVFFIDSPCERTETPQAQKLLTVFVSASSMMQKINLDRHLIFALRFSAVS